MKQEDGAQILATLIMQLRGGTVRVWHVEASLQH